MNRKKIYMLLISMLLFQFFVITEVSGREVRPFETEGSIGFTGVYVPIGLPDPPPDTTTDEPNAPIRIARPDPNISNNHRNFPKTNANKSHLLFLLGVLLLFILWLYKKKRK
ncbi:hypothetical protein IGJ48_002777 [Enterococcus pernyi]